MQISQKALMARFSIFFVVIREVILQKMAPILDPVNFFSVLTLISHCAWHGGSNDPHPFGIARFSKAPVPPILSSVSFVFGIICCILSWVSATDDYVGLVESELSVFLQRQVCQSLCLQSASQNIAEWPRTSSKPTLSVNQLYQPSDTVVPTTAPSSPSHWLTRAHRIAA